MRLLRFARNDNKGGSKPGFGIKGAIAQYRTSATTENLNNASAPFT
ncbi:hypothetical protein OSCI_1150002 [Kamptonema sp. PCC 6506]|nr:hypothetical protein OSCI_1150002 [Kamptonema sp. PCC 6506]